MLLLSMPLALSSDVAAAVTASAILSPLFLLLLLLVPPHVAVVAAFPAVAAVNVRDPPPVLLSGPALCSPLGGWRVVVSWTSSIVDSS